jgi:hypothetical protein
MRSGKLTVKAGKCKAGDVVRIPGLDVYGDATVLKVSKDSVRLARPYVKAYNGVAMTGVEVWEIVPLQEVLPVGKNYVVQRGS